MNKQAAYKKKDKLRTQYNQYRYIRETCFHIYGFPDWYKELKEKMDNSIDVIAYSGKISVNPSNQSGDNRTATISVLQESLKELTMLVKGKSSNEIVNWMTFVHNIAGMVQFMLLLCRVSLILVIG